MEADSLVGSYHSINSWFVNYSQSVQKGSEVFGMFAKKTEEIQKRNSTSFETLLNKLEAQTREISNQKLKVADSQTDYFRISGNCEKSKESLRVLAKDLKASLISLNDYDRQVRNSAELEEYMLEKSGIYKSEVDLYNVKMHQLFQNLPQFLSTLSLWDREKECMFISMDNFLKDDSGLFEDVRKENLENDVTRKLEYLAKIEASKTYVSFQERLQMSSKVLLYIENFSCLKIGHVSWEEETNQKRRETMDFEDFAFFADDTPGLNDEEREILRLILSCFLSEKGEKDFNFAFCGILLEEFFSKENVVDKFLKKFCKKLKENKRKLILNNERFFELEKILLRILESWLKSFERNN